jgi:hypothetical protein
MKLSKEQFEQFILPYLSKGSRGPATTLSFHAIFKGDKAVVFCDRDCNVIAPLVAAAGNRNESPLLRQALPQLTKIAHALGLDLQGSIMSLDGVYGLPAQSQSHLQSRHGKREAQLATFRHATDASDHGALHRNRNTNGFPTSIRTRAAESIPSEVVSRGSIQPSSKNGSVPSSGYLPGKTSSGVCCFALTVSVNCTTPSRPSLTR